MPHKERTAMPRKPLESHCEKGFAQGVAWAVAVLERSCGETSLAEILLYESGISKNSFRRACDPYDYNVVRKFFDRDERWAREMKKLRNEQLEQS
jgi:hypothetical protein